MRALRRFLSRLAASATRSRDEDRLKEEIEEHLAIQTAENVRAGLSPVEARRQAVLEFGAVEAIKEQYRQEQRLPLLDDLVQDVRYALRRLHKAPLFTFTVTMSLALGIGANTAVFAVIERVLLRSLPVSEPEALVYVTDDRILREQSPRFSYPFYQALRENRILDGVAARAVVSATIAFDAHVARITAELVSGSYASVLGSGAQIGRWLSPEDDRTPGAHPVAVISHRFWVRSFASDPSVLGRAVRINEHTFTVVGVAAEAFTGTDVGHPAEIWLPMSMQREVGRDFLTDARTNWIEIIGRLSSGMSLARAGAELTGYLQRRAPELQARQPGWRLMLVPAGKGSSPVRRELGPALRVLLALTGLALALACVNVASLLAVRSAAREKEIALRLALGARRSRLTRQLLTETLVLAAIGGTAGLIVAPWAAHLLIASQPHPLVIDASLDLRMFLFGLSATALAGLAIGLAPILAFRRAGLASAIGNSRMRSPAASRRFTTHDLIVTFQIAMALAMLISAGLFVQSLRNLNSVDPGFRADNILLASLDPKAAGYDNAMSIETFWRNTLDRVNRIPGVRSASVAGIVPLGSGRQRQPWVNPISGEVLEVDTAFVGPGYFRTLEIPLRRGREFDSRDGKTSRPVVVVNEHLARMFWPQQDPIGKGVRLPDGGNPAAEVVGLVKDVKYRDLRGEAVPMMYRALFQSRTTDAMTLHVRSTGDAAPLTPAIRRELQALDPDVPLFRVTTLDEWMDASFGQTRQAAVLTGVFGLIALLLSGIGVYGVAALAVSRQTRDIGIRMALGARKGDIVRAIGRRGLPLVGAGLGLGLFGSFAFTQVARTLLYGVNPRDSLTFAAMAVLLGVVSAVAFYIPVRTATRMDALAAIRCE